jgi:hypothetical protein
LIVPLELAGALKFKKHSLESCGRSDVERLQEMASHNLVKMTGEFYFSRDLGKY